MSLPKNCINPPEGLLGVFFHTELQQAVNKAYKVPALMKQMALQLINEIPRVDIQIYTDGSKNEKSQSGSGIYIKTPKEVRKIKLRNPDNCSVFRSELLAIEAGLEAIFNENNYGAVWILSDSRSSIQHLKDWNNVGDRTGISILKLLRHIVVDHEVHLQWIPSHVDIYGNEVADNLAKQGTSEPLCSTPSLTFDEIYSIRKNKDLKNWRAPPSHDWYKRSSPGDSIGLACDRTDQTALSRFVSGHLRSCSFSHGNKVFPVCAKCGVASASPEHILSCLRLSRETFETDPLLALDFLRKTYSGFESAWMKAADDVIHQILIPPRKVENHLDVEGCLPSNHYQRRRSRAVLYQLSGHYKQDKIKSKLKLNNNLLHRPAVMPEYKAAAIEKSRFILSHYGLFKTCWDWLILIGTFYVAIVVPYSATFRDTGETPLFNKTIITDVIMESIFIIGVYMFSDGKLSNDLFVNRRKGLNAILLNELIVNFGEKD
ncbi:Potassium voltage-gated channel subfamily H member 8 [Araneus ventricosus]|uniref:Potassium voltage-gated channel subfamily H member 8 n=1 Tax=Araneus ventricosus TaxID=182803 RepID=A0A4Y2B8W1_ARAVE|nr:Potassium voltage-gated channel subfamily H member 8 [Araneus ventricosus]